MTSIIFNAPVEVIDGISHLTSLFCFGLLVTSCLVLTWGLLLFSKCLCGPSVGRWACGPQGRQKSSRCCSLHLHSTSVSYLTGELLSLGWSLLATFSSAVCHALFSLGHPYFSGEKRESYIVHLLLLLWLWWWLLLLYIGINCFPYVKMESKEYFCVF